MNKKKWFYVTVRRTQTWNLSVQALTNKRAREEADRQVDSIVNEPDYTDWEQEVEEVRKHVE